MRTVRDYHGGRGVTDEPMVERLERLEREATPGPWAISDYTTVTDESSWGVHINSDAGGPVACWSDKEWDFACYDDSIAADAALIVAMRNALPALLSQLREQRERADDLQDQRNYPCIHEQAYRRVESELLPAGHLGNHFEYFPVADERTTE